MECKVPGCYYKPFNGRGICRGCYNRFRGTENLDLYPPIINMTKRSESKPCVVDGCLNRDTAPRGMCRTHYNDLTIRGKFDTLNGVVKLYEPERKMRKECWNRHCSSRIENISQAIRMLCSDCMGIVWRRKLNDKAPVITPLERFLITMSEEVVRKDGCLEWPGNRDRAGYGRFHHNNTNYKAHRVALEIKLGREMEPGMLSMHSCDNPPCVSYDHLSEGTVRDNALDMIAKGRASWQKEVVL